MTDPINIADGAKSPDVPVNPTVIKIPKPNDPQTTLIVKASHDNLPDIKSAVQLLSDDSLVVPSEIVGGLIHQGTKTILASGSKIGKTWVLLDLLTSVVSGTPFLERPTIAGPALLVNLEIAPAFMKERIETMQAKKGLSSLENLDVWTLRGQSLDIETLVDQIIERTKDTPYKLIVIDPIYKLMTGRSENAASGVGLLAHHIERIVENTGAAVVYAHHFTKGNAAKKKSIDRMSGSGVFARDADTIITLTEHVEKDCYTVEMTLRNLPPQAPFVVEWTFPIMVQRPDLNASDLKVEGEEDAEELEPLLQLLDEKPLTSGAWQEAAEEAGYSRATFFRKKQELEDGKYLAFNRKQKTWARAGADQPESIAKTVGTNETTEGKPQSAVPVSSPKSLNSSDKQ